MKVLIDSNVFIAREESDILSEELRTVLREVKEKYGGPWVHPESVNEVINDPNEERRQEAQSRIESYPKLEYPERPSPNSDFREHVPKSESENERVDNCLLYSVYTDEADFLITEDQGIHTKAQRVSREDRVFTIKQARNYFETGPAPISEGPDIEKTKLGDLNIDDPIFDSLRSDYDEFEEWAQDKADREAWINKKPDRGLGALLVIKPEEIEGIGSNPELRRERRTKISTFKVAPERRGSKLGERLLSIAFRRAVGVGTEKIYLTYYEDESGNDKLVRLIENFGFSKKSSKDNGEAVFQKRLVPDSQVDPEPVELASDFYPSFYDGHKVKKHLVPVRPEFHDKLFPRYSDQTELQSFTGQSRAEGNSIKKAYISNSPSRKVEEGDVLLFYRSEASEVTSIGICDGAHYRLGGPQDVKRVVGRRSVFSDSELRDRVNDGDTNVLMFLWHFHLDDPVTLDEMKEAGVRETAPISTQEIDHNTYQHIIDKGNLDDSFTCN